MLSCSGANLDAIVISTGVAIDNEFGASPKVYAQIDDGKPMWDRAVLAIRDDSKTLAFGSHNGIGGTKMLFAKKYVVRVESYGRRVVGMEFEIPSNSSAILRYCGLLKPTNFDFEGFPHMQDERSDSESKVPINALPVPIKFHFKWTGSTLIGRVGVQSLVKPPSHETGHALELITLSREFAEMAHAIDQLEPHMLIASLAQCTLHP